MYGLDLPADLGTPRLTFRRLRLLLELSPWDSEYIRSRVGERADWNPEHHLLATISDQLAMYDWNRRAERAKDGKHRRPPAPEPIARPGKVQTQHRHRTTLTPREIARRLVEQQRKSVAAPRT